MIRVHIPYPIALDATARVIDTDGRMHINRSHISKAGVNPYYGREIPGYATLGLDPDRIYMMFRPPEELEKAAPTFARNQILFKHMPIHSSDPQTDLIVGAIGSNVEFNDPYLDADLVFWDDKAIAGIESNTLRELSAAYHYLPVMIGGEYKGQPYDGSMTEIRGNHLATVEAGRAGSDVLAADSQLEIPKMKMTKLGKALLVTLRSAFPAIAQDAALEPMLATVTRKNLDAPALRAKLVAMDASVKGEEVDTVMDAFTDSEDEPEAKEKKKVAEDEEEETEEEKAKRLKKEKDDEDKPAQDAQIALDARFEAFKKEQTAANEARIAVRDVVGDVAMDSAAEIYGFALDHMGVKHAGVEGVVALKTIFDLANEKRVAVAPVVALDASFHKDFANVSRFGQR